MRQRFVNMLNDMKFRNKLLLTFLLVSLLPVLLIGAYFTIEIRTLAFANAMEQASSNVDRVKKRTEEVVGVSIDIAYRMMNDLRLKRLLSRNYANTFEVVDAYRNYTEISGYVRLYRDISSIRVYTDNQTLLNNWEFINPSPEVEEAEWYQQIKEFGGLSRWVYLQDERDKQNYLSLVRRIDLEGYYARNAVLVINVSSEQLNAILSQEVFETMIVDDEHHIIAANRPERIGQSLSDISFDTGLLENGDGSYEVDVDGQPSRIVIEGLDPQASVNGLRIVSVFSIDSIVKEPNRVILLAVTVIFISVLLALVLIVAFSSLFSRRLLQLSKYINKVGTGDFGAAIRIDGNDEIGLLARQFNSMVRSINELMVEVQRTSEQNHQLEQKQNDIRFKMLASQINPHFLFNALESIRMEAHMKGQAEIARIVRLLGKMMRSNLEVGRNRIPLKQELEIVSCYLEIQQFRYEERLDYRLEVEPGFEMLQLPPLIIQPLVENAVVHGLDNKPGKMIVTVKAFRVDDTVRFEVTDDGSGISQERLDQVRHMLEDSEDHEGQRIGLRNVHDRLKLTYGGACGLTIESRQDEGTTLSFSIPLDV